MNFDAEMMGSMDLDQIVADAQKAFGEAQDVTTLENEKARRSEERRVGKECRL